VEPYDPDILFLELLELERVQEKPQEEIGTVQL